MHVLIPQHAHTGGSGEDGHATAKSAHGSRPFVRYRVPDCRSWNAQYVAPYLVGNDTNSVDLLYTLQEWSRWCVNATDSEAVDRE